MTITNKFTPALIEAFTTLGARLVPFYERLNAKGETIKYTNEKGWNTDNYVCDEAKLLEAPYVAILPSTVGVTGIDVDGVYNPETDNIIHLKTNAHIATAKTELASAIGMYLHSSKSRSKGVHLNYLNDQLTDDQKTCNGQWYMDGYSGDIRNDALLIIYDPDGLLAAILWARFLQWFNGYTSGQITSEIFDTLTESETYIKRAKSKVNKKAKKAAKKKGKTEAKKELRKQVREGTWETKIRFDDGDGRHPRIRALINELRRQKKWSKGIESAIYEKVANECPDKTTDEIDKLIESARKKSIGFVPIYEMVEDTMADALKPLIAYRTGSVERPWYYRPLGAHPECLSWMPDPGAVNVDAIIGQWLHENRTPNVTSGLIGECKRLLRQYLKADPDFFDTDEFCIADASGRVYDLRKGMDPITSDDDMMTCYKDRVGSARNHITKHLGTTISTNDDPTPHKFLKSLKQWLPKEEGVFEWYSAFLGSCLTGSTRDEKMVVNVGDGGDGKTTLAECLYYVLGDFAWPINREDIVGKRTRHLQWLVKLTGRRMAMVAELQKGDWKSAALKSLVSSDTDVAHNMREEDQTVKHSAKIMIAANGLPKTATQDIIALGRRLVIVDFLLSLDDTNKDSDIHDKLRAEAPEILHWLMTQAHQYVKNGCKLPELPKSLVRRRDEYIADQDPYYEWFQDCLRFDPDRWVRTVDLMNHSNHYLDEKSRNPGTVIKRVFKYAKYHDIDGVEKRRIRTTPDSNPVTVMYGVDLTPDAKASLDTE